MALGRRRQRRRLNAEVNIINLVDVVLVLLIIFMITAPMMQNGIEVKLPKANAKPVTITDKDLEIAVRQNGTVTYGKSQTSMPIARFIDNLERIVATSQSTRILVSGEGKVNLDLLMPLWAGFQQAKIPFAMIAQPASRR